MNEAIFIKDRYPEIKRPALVDDIIQTQSKIWETVGELSIHVGVIEFAEDKNSGLKPKFEIDEAILDEYCGKIIDLTLNLKESYLKLKRLSGA